MALQLTIIDGPRAGASHPISPGITIGRTQGEIQIRDQKVSSLHCRIDQDGEALVLVDLGSSNKIKVENEKLDRLELRPGQRFVLGNTVLEVQVIETQEPTFVTDGQGELRDWRSTLAEELERLSRAKLKGAPQKILMFRPLMLLEFVEGPQTGTIWYLSYGPRSVGARSPDLTLDEPGCPDESFIVTPEGSKGPVLKTKFPESVSLNGLPVVSEKLKDGDVISINKTKIVVKFKE